MRVGAALLLITIFAIGIVGTAQNEPAWWNLNSLTTARPAPRSDAAMAADYSDVLVEDGLRFLASANRPRRPFERSVQPRFANMVLGRRHLDATAS